MEWYYADQGQQKGPIDEAALDQLIAAGAVRRRHVGVARRNGKVVTALFRARTQVGRCRCSAGRRRHTLLRGMRQAIPAGSTRRHWRCLDLRNVQTSTFTATA